MCFFEFLAKFLDFGSVGSYDESGGICVDGDDYVVDSSLYEGEGELFLGK